MTPTMITRYRFSVLLGLLWISVWQGMAQSGVPYGVDVFDFRQGGPFKNSVNLRITEDGLGALRPDEPTEVESSQVPLPSNQTADFTAIAPEIYWNAPTGSSLRVMVRFIDGAGHASDWQMVSRCYGDPHGSRRWVGNLITAPPQSVAYQYSLSFYLRSDRPPLISIPQLRMHRIHIQTAPLSGPMPTQRQHQVLNQQCDSIPAYVPRSAWGAPTSSDQPHPKPGCTQGPGYAPITHLALHHTGTANQAPNWPAMVQALWYYHTRVLERCDIGYNWLIDPDGRLYEGTAGGYQVVSDHLCVKSYSTGTVSVGLLGTYVEQSPSSLALHKLRQLLVWQTCNADIDPQMTSSLIAGPQLPHLFTPDALCSDWCAPTRLTTLLPTLRSLVADGLANLTTQVQDLQSTGRFRIFPNPSAGHIEVELVSSYTQPATLSVLNQQGAVVHQRRWSLLAGTNRYDLRLTHLPPGLYYLQLQTDQSVAAHKVQITK